MEAGCATLGANGITVRGDWNGALQGSGVHGVQMAEVEVDIETGKVRVLKLVGIHDCGLPLNRAAIESQINGGMIQGLGYALLEHHVVDPQTGLMLNASLEDYKIPGCVEMPELIPMVDDGDTRNVVIGMAEPGAIPGAERDCQLPYTARAASASHPCPSRRTKSSTALRNLRKAASVKKPRMTRRNTTLQYDF